jgi:hypothetical protein
MRIDRRTRARVLLGLAIGISWPIAGCGSGGGSTAEVSPEAQKKVQTMLNNIPGEMKAKHQAEAAAKKAAAAARK